METTRGIGIACGLVLFVGCNVGPGDDSVVSGGVTDTAPGQDTDGAGSDADDDDDAGTDDGADGFPDDGGDGPGDSGDPVDPAAVCEVPADALDAPGPCTEEEVVLADDFNPAVQWAIDLSDCQPYQEGAGSELVVANLTDDNDDGVVDQCDVPDVAYTCHRTGEGNGVALFVVDGATGETHLEHSELNIEEAMGGTYHYYPTLAAADVDGDGAAELVWAHYTQISSKGEMDQEGTYEAFLTVEAVTGDGTVLWSSDFDDTYNYWGLGISSADLDGDGTPTLLVGHRAISNEGALVWELPDYSDYWYHSGDPVTADLDADGKLEVIWGRRVYEHDGTLRFELPELDYEDPYQWGWDVAVADLDEDGAPELVIDNRGHYNDAGDYGDHIVHAVSASGEVMASVAVDADEYWYDYYGWDYGSRNGGIAVADIDGDGDVEALVASGRLGVSVVDFEGGELVEVLDVEHPEVPEVPQNEQWYYGHGAVTAFDFLGTGQSQIVRTGLGGVAVFSIDGALLFDHQIEPAPDEYYYEWGWGHDAIAIADVDNDGAAEIVAKTGYDHFMGDVADEPQLVVFEDPEQRMGRCPPDLEPDLILRLARARRRRRAPGGSALVGDPQHLPRPVDPDALDLRRFYDPGGVSSGKPSCSKVYCARRTRAMNFTTPSGISPPSRRYRRTRPPPRA